MISVSQRPLGSLLLGIWAAHCLQAQTNTRFDVASVRPNRASACHGCWDLRASRGAVNAENAPLLSILSRAFNLTGDRVSGPAWLESECYDMKANAAPNVPDRDLMPMLQELLKERFHLVACLESETRPVFVLSVEKGASQGKSLAVR